jgi:hypothetical protein
LDLPKFGYFLVKRNKLIGLGATTYKALCNYDFKARGLRLSVYAKKEIRENIMKNEDFLQMSIGSTQKSHICSSRFLRNKGAIACYIRLSRQDDQSDPSDLKEKYITIAFINAHLPFDSQSLMDSYIKHNPMIRENSVQMQNISFNQILESLVWDLPNKPDYVIYFGDFNYRLKQFTSALNMVSILENPSDCKNINQYTDNREIYRYFYQNYDELYQQFKKGNIYVLHEGCQNNGPLFLQTCKLLKNRGDNYAVGSFSTGSIGQRPPSWCDRILYQTLNEDCQPIECIFYDRFDVGRTMKLSDHSGVIGLYQISF